MKTLSLVCFLLVCSIVVEAQQTGRVTGIADGDTFNLLSGGKQIKVRLYGIDCPERGQDYHQVAKQFLSDLIYNKTVTIKQTGTDRYRRVIAVVYIGNVNVNEYLLSAGLAWHYKRYDNNEDWAQLEKQARQRAKNIWSKSNPVAPWEFRKR